MSIVNFSTPQFFDHNEVGRAMPVPEVYRLVTTVAVKRDASPPLASAFNSSYTLDFLGPALKCGEANASIEDTVSEQFPQATPNHQLLYFSWVPSSPNGTNISSLLLSDADKLATLDETSPDTARIYLALYVAYHVKVWHCDLYNASYTAEFRFENGIGSTEIKKLIYPNGVPAVTRYDDALKKAPLLDKIGVMSYSAVLTAIGKLLIGSIKVSPLMLHGTTILSTALADTQELQKCLRGSSNQSENQPYLAPSLEQLSQNITLSFFSLPEYL